jgi:hypothetical protein
MIPLLEFLPPMKIADENCDCDETYIELSGGWQQKTVRYAKEVCAAHGGLRH